MEIKMEMPLQCVKRYVQEYDLSGTFDRLGCEQEFVYTDTIH